MSGIVHYVAGETKLRKPAKNQPDRNETRRDSRTALFPHAVAGSLDLSSPFLRFEAAEVGGNGWARLPAQSARPQRIFKNIPETLDRPLPVLPLAAGVPGNNTKLAAGGE